MDFVYSLTETSPDGAYHIGPGELKNLRSFRSGLIIGPDILHIPGIFVDLSKELSGNFGVDDQGSYFGTVDEILKNGTSKIDVLDFIKNYYDEVHKSPQTSLLAKIPWSAVLSFCQTSHFDTELLQHCSANPAMRVPTTIVNPIPALEPRTFPVYKLLGDTTSP